MSTEERPERTERPKRRPRRPETPQNNPKLGAILVGAAAFVGLLLFIAGGGGDSDTEESASGVEETAQDNAATDESTTTIPPSTVPPAQLEIIAANGAGVPGLAGDTAGILGAAGYTNVESVDGDSTPDTQVYFVEGSDTDAAFVIDVLQLGMDRLKPMPADPPLVGTELGTAKVVILLGPDFNPEIVAAANAASTTAADEG